MNVFGALWSWFWAMVRFGMFSLGVAGVLNGLKLHERTGVAPYGVLSALHVVAWSSMVYLHWRKRKAWRTVLFLLYTAGNIAFMLVFFEKPLAFALFFSILLAGYFGRKYLDFNPLALNELLSDDDGGAVVVTTTNRKKRDLPWTAVLLEGNICAGKSTYARDVARTNDGVQVHLEKVLPELHRAFIKQPEIYGFALQMTMAERRTMLLQRVTERDFAPPAVVDRSVIGDYAFAAWNYVIGSLSEVEFRQVYCDDFANKPSLMLQRFVMGNQSRPVMVVYLCQPALVCAERLANRTGDDQSTSIEYLRGISIAHSLAMADVARNSVGLAEVRILASPTKTPRLEELYKNKRVPRKMHGAENEGAYVALRSDESVRRFKWLVKHLLGTHGTFDSLVVGNDEDGWPLVCEHRCFNQLVAALE